MYKVIRKTPIFDNYKIIQTEIYIAQEEPFVQMLYKIDGDHFNANDDEVIKLILDTHYNDTFPNRAENEKFQEVNKELKRSNELAETTRQALINSSEQTLSNKIDIELLIDDVNYIAKHLKLKLPSEVEENEEERETERAVNEENGTT